MSSKFFYSSLKKNQKDSNDFLPRKLNLEVKFWHFLTPTHKTMILFDYSWFLDKDLSNFVSLPWKLYILYCHKEKLLQNLDLELLHIVPFDNLYFSKTGPESKTYLFDFETLKWYPGVDLQYPRFGHACGLHKIEDRFVLFVVGGNAQKANSEVVQDSVEMLVLESARKWQAGELTYIPFYINAIFLKNLLEKTFLTFKKWVKEYTIPELYWHSIQKINCMAADN